MKRRWLIILLLIIARVVVQGQDYFMDQTVKGVVLDKETKEPLPGVVVRMDNDSVPVLVTATDAQGQFEFKIPLGRQSFLVQLVGYKGMIIPNVLVTSGKEVELVVELSQSITEMKEVEILASKDNLHVQNSMAAVSVNQLNTSEASRLAGNQFDPSRAASYLPGVSTVDGDMNEMVVRGNSPRGVLWRLNGVEIPNPNHFPDGQGGSGGSLNMISSELLASFDFFTGAFPAEYGNATSGVMDLNLRKGNTNTREYSVVVGDVGTQVCAEGPINKKRGSSYLVNYRYSSFALVNKLKMVDLGSNSRVPLFQDMVVNLHMPAGARGKIEIFGLGGSNSTGTSALLDSTTWNSWDDRRDESEYHYLMLAGIRHLYHFPNRNTYINTVFINSQQFDDWTKSYIVQDYRRQAEQHENYRHNCSRLSTTVNHRLSQRLSFRSGIVASYIKSDMFQDVYKWGSQHNKIVVNSSKVANSLQMFVQSKYWLTNRLNLVAGLHFDGFAFNKNYSLEPRTSLTYRLGEKSSLSLGSGIHSKIEALPVYSSLVTMKDGSTIEGNENLRFSKAFHLVAAYEIIPSRSYRFRAEAYFQYLYDVPIVDNPYSNYSLINIPYGLPEEQLVNKGAGKNVGVELTLERFFSNNLYYTATVSLFDSKFRAGDGRWYNTTYNNNYIANILAGKELELGKKKNTIVGANTKLVLRGGYRTTPIDLQGSIAADETVYEREQTNKKKYPAMFELNFGTSLRRNCKKFSWTLSIDLQNVLNQKNILATEYRGSNKSIATIKGVGFVPVLFLKFEF